MADAAAAWLTVLMSGEASPQDQQRWQDWHSADPEHARAWSHIEAVTARMGLLDPGAAYRSLASGQPSSSGRRRALKLLAWSGAVGASGLLLTRLPAWQQAMADYRTGTGEQRDLVLDDGSRITLNTASALDVRFDARQRRLHLLRGEAYIVTGHGTPAANEQRPFLFDTAAGRVQALGTRFMLRHQGDRTEVWVFEGAVRVTPGAARAATRIVQSGQRLAFDARGLGPLGTADEQSAAWKDGLIVADQIRLDEFLADLGRYRSGILSCDPAIAGLKVSGVFPLRNTDQILATLPQVLPVRVRAPTRYWVTLEAAH
ncbi:MAG TPA: iron dicitrate transport regulator FecR [Xanthomonadaceae bacterium]|nr:iron dicitrate transport regulator FecR [Xanthomonadaceae bacterium]